MDYKATVKKEIGDQPPSFSIQEMPAPLPVELTSPDLTLKEDKFATEDFNEVNAQDVDKFNKDVKKYNEIVTQEIEPQVSLYNRQVDELSGRIDQLDNLYNEIEKEIGTSPVDIDALTRRSAQITSIQNDLDDQYNKFILNPYGEQNEQGYFKEIDLIIEKEQKINDEITGINNALKQYNLWVEKSNSAPIQALEAEYEEKIKILNTLQNNLTNNKTTLTPLLKWQEDFKEILERSSNSVDVYIKDLNLSIKDKNERYQANPLENISSAQAFLPLPPVKFAEPDLSLKESERSIEALNMVYTRPPLNADIADELLKDNLEEKEKEIEQIKGAGKLLQEVDPNSRFSKKPFKLTVGDFNPLNILPYGQDSVQNKINEIEDKALTWLDKNIGQKEVGDFIQYPYLYNKAYVNFVLSGGKDKELMTLSGVEDLKNFEFDDGRKINVDFGKSPLSPTWNTVADFTDIPYYYDEIKKVKNLEIINLDGNSATPRSDIDDYAVAVASLGGITPEITNLIGKQILPLRVPSKLLTDAIQSPEIMRTPEYWLDGAFTEPPKFKTNYLIRPDSYRDNKPLGDVLFKSEQNARIRAKYEDENGNPPEDFKWALSPNFTKNTPFLKLDQDYINSPTYDKYLEYQQAVFDDRYRYADLIFTVAEIAFLGTALKKGANLAVLPAKIALSPVSDVIDTAKPFINKRRPQLDSSSQKAIDLMNTPDANLTAENVVNKRLLTVAKNTEDFDKKINLDTYEFKIKEYLSLPDKVKNSKLIPRSWFNSFTQKEVAKIQNEANKLYENIAKNGISGQIKTLENSSFKTSKDKAMLSYLQELDTKTDLGSLEDFIIKTPSNKENVIERYFSGLETTPQFNEIAKYLDTDFYKLSEMGDSLNPNKALFSSTNWDKSNNGYNLNNIQLGLSKIENYDNLPKKDKKFELQILSNELYEADKTGKLAEKLGLSKTQLNNPIEDIVLNLEEIKRISQIEKKILKTKIDNLKNSNTLKLSPVTNKSLNSIFKDLDPRRIRNVTNKEENLFGKAPPKETIDIGKKDFKSVMNKEQNLFVKDGSKFEAEIIKKKFSDEDFNTPKGKPIKDPNDTKKQKDPKEPDGNTPEVFPTEKLDPDASKKVPKDPDASKKDPDASKKDPDASKKDIQKKKKPIKSKDPKKLKDPSEIKKKKKKPTKDPDDIAKKKKKRIRDRKLSLPSGGGGQGKTIETKKNKLFPSVVQWKDGEKYITYNLNTNEKKIRDYPATGGVKEGDTPSKSLKIIRKSNLRPKGFNRKIGNLTLQIKSPEVVTVKKLEKKIYNNNKELSFRR